MSDIKQFLQLLEKATNRGYVEDRDDHRSFNVAEVHFALMIREDPERKTEAFYDARWNYTDKLRRFQSKLSLVGAESRVRVLKTT